MKTRLFLLLSLLIAVTLLAACLQTPAPLPDAPTRIPTLIAATMPAPGLEATAQAAAAGVSFPVSAPVAADGATVYAEKCASCHGADGSGQVPNSRDFTDQDYMRGAAPVTFFRAVTGGQGEMPGFKTELTDAERWSAVYYLWQFAVPAAEITRGQAVYAEAGCVACHGDQGQGVIPQAAKFSPEFVAKWPASQFYQSVSAGKGIMPAHQDRLPSEDRWAAVEYARAFGYQNASK